MVALCVTKKRVCITLPPLKANILFMGDTSVSFSGRRYGMSTLFPGIYYRRPQHVVYSTLFRVQTVSSNRRRSIVIFTLYCLDGCNAVRAVKTGAHIKAVGEYSLRQCFSTFVRQRPGKFFFS